MTRFLAMSMLAFAFTGCGTNGNLCQPGVKERATEERERGARGLPAGGYGGSPRLGVYGGVANDVEMIRELVTTEEIATKLIATAFVVDIPLSLVGDTVTLPLTLAATVNRTINEANRQKPSKPEQISHGLRDSQPTAATQLATPATEGTAPNETGGGK